MRTVAVHLPRVFCRYATTVAAIAFAASYLPLSDLGIGASAYWRYFWTASLAAVAILATAFGTRMRSKSPIDVATAIATFILKVVCLAAAGYYMALIVIAQSECSLVSWFGRQCHGPEGDVWMGPFLGAPLGMPILIIAGIIVVFSLRRGK